MAQLQASQLQRECELAAARLVEGAQHAWQEPRQAPLQLGSSTLGENVSTPRGRQLPSDYTGKSGNEMVTPGGKAIAKLPLTMTLAANQTAVIYVEVQPTTPSSSPSRL